MARQSLTKTLAPGSYSYTGEAVNYQAQIADGSQFRMTGREILLVKNPDSVDHTVTIKSTNTVYGRTQDISTYNIPAGTTEVFGMFKQHGWQQDDGNLYIDGETSLELAVITIKS